MKSIKSFVISLVVVCSSVYAMENGLGSNPAQPAETVEQADLRVRLARGQATLEMQIAMMRQILAANLNLGEGFPAEAQQAVQQKVAEFDAVQAAAAAGDNAAIQRLQEMYVQAHEFSVATARLEGAWTTNNGNPDQDFSELPEDE